MDDTFNIIYIYCSYFEMYDGCHVEKWHVVNMHTGYAEVPGGSTAVRLPWGAVRERVAFPESIHVNVNNKPGAFVLQMIFAEFTVLAEKKIEQALDSQVSCCTQL